MEDGWVDEMMVGKVERWMGKIEKWVGKMERRCNILYNSTRGAAYTLVFNKVDRHKTNFYS